VYYLWAIQVVASGLRGKPAMSSEPKQVKQVVLDEKLWELLDEMGEQSGYRDNRGVHSKLIREMVAAAALKWRESPYVCQSAKHVALVTRDGHVFYRQLQELRLNTKRERLPCQVEMKPEKRQDYQRNRPLDKEEGTLFRSLWLLNYFAVWQGSDTQSPPLSRWVDRDGIDSKAADLTVNAIHGTLTREILVGVRDYVQWYDGVPGYDRIDLPIDIPTRNLEFSVIVDMELYGNRREEDIPNLEIEFRNREGACCESRKIGEGSENRLKPFPGRTPSVIRSPKLADVKKSVESLRERVREVAAEVLDLGQGDEPVVAAESLEMVRHMVTTPERFLFLKIEWPSPFWGLQVCIRWEKPKRSR
jgi:hypothetical protein